MVTSFTPNPAWVARNSQTALDVSRITAQTNAAVSRSIMGAWEYRGAVLSRVMGEAERVRLGIDVYSDPTTGSQYTVANTSRYYWVNPGGGVVGTDTDTSPGPTFRPLTRVPPQ
jgi:hypothetical protein